MSTATAYPGPLRGQPLAIELHNTVYAAGGEAVDGIGGERALESWLRAVRELLPAEARSADPRRLADVHRLREAVRELLHAAVEERPARPAAVRAVNDTSLRSPRSLQLVERRGAEARAAVDHHGADPTDIALGEIAVDAIDLVTGDRRGDLGRCAAPGCVLMFLRDHPRRAWCSPACGNRTRQARHYRRTHPGRDG